MNPGVIRLLAFGCAAFAAIGGCTVIVNPGEAEEDFTLNTSATDVETLRVRWVNGAIVIRVDDAATEITADGVMKVVAASDAEAEDALEDIEIAFETTDAVPSRRTLRFEAPDSSLTKIYSAEVEVVLPAGMDLDIDTVNGPVTVTGNTGVTEIQVTNGTVNVTAQAGDTDVDVTNGEVTVISTAGNVRADVVNGGISITAEPADDGSVVALTNVGDIEIFVPADIAASVDLRGGIGQVSAEWNAFDDVDNITSGAARLQATLNGGGGEVTAETDVGTVELDAITADAA